METSEREAGSVHSEPLLTVSPTGSPKSAGSSTFRGNMYSAKRHLDRKDAMMRSQRVLSNRDNTKKETEYWKITKAKSICTGFLLKKCRPSLLGSNLRPKWREQYFYLDDRGITSFKNILEFNEAVHRHKGCLPVQTIQRADFKGEDPRSIHREVHDESGRRFEISLVLQSSSVSDHDSEEFISITSESNRLLKSWFEGIVFSFYMQNCIKSMSHRRYFGSVFEKPETLNDVAGLLNREHGVSSASLSDELVESKPRSDVRIGFLGFFRGYCKQILDESERNDDFDCMFEYFEDLETEEDIFETMTSFLQEQTPIHHSTALPDPSSAEDGLFMARSQFLRFVASFDFEPVFAKILCCEDTDMVSHGLNLYWLAVHHPWNSFHICCTGQSNDCDVCEGIATKFQVFVADHFQRPFALTKSMRSVLLGILIYGTWNGEEILAMSQSIKTPGMWKTVFFVLQNCHPSDPFLEYVLKDINALLLQNHTNCKSIYTLTDWEKTLISLVPINQEERAALEEADERNLRFIIFICCMVIYDGISLGTWDWKSSLCSLIRLLNYEADSSLLIQALINKTTHELTSDPECSIPFIKRFNDFGGFARDFLISSQFKLRYKAIPEKMSNAWESIVESRSMWIDYESNQSVNEIERIAKTQFEYWADALVFTQLVAVKKEERERFVGMFVSAGKSSKSRKNVLRKMVNK